MKVKKMNADLMVKQAMNLPIVSACSECRYLVNEKYRDDPSFWQCGVTCGYAKYRNKDGRCMDFEPVAKQPVEKRRVGASAASKVLFGCSIFMLAVSIAVVILNTLSASVR